MKEKGDLFLHFITGEFYRIKEIVGEKIILECLNEPWRWWIGEEREFGQFFKRVKEIK